MVRSHERTLWLQDKLIGKAAALLIHRLGIRTVEVGILSRPGEAVLQCHADRIHVCAVGGPHSLPDRNAAGGGDGSRSGLRPPESASCWNPLIRGSPEGFETAGLRDDSALFRVLKGR